MKLIVYNLRSGGRILGEIVLSSTGEATSESSELRRLIRPAGVHRVPPTAGSRYLQALAIQYSNSTVIRMVKVQSP